MNARRTVMVVEDDEDLRRMYRHVLMFAGYDVRDASNGRSALLQIDLERPDVLVLDLFLPGITGLEVMQDIASHAYTAQIPVVIVTGSAMNLDHLEVSCVLRKPVTGAELLSAVARVA